MRKLSSLLLALMAFFTFANAEIIERVLIDDLYYNLDTENKTAEVTFKSYENDNNNDVFNKDWKITAANIPSSVSYSNENYIVTSIGDYAFWGCSKLASVTIPNSVITIKNYALILCTDLTSITVDAENPNYSDIDGVSYLARIKRSFFNIRKENQHHPIQFPIASQALEIMHFIIVPRWPQ